MDQKKPLPEDTLLHEYGNVFGSPSGQVILRDLQESFHYHTPMFEPGMTDMHLAFREGQRSVVLWLTLTVEAALYKSDEVQTHYGNEQPHEEHA